MATNTDADKPSTIWTPLYRADLEALLDRQEYTTLHLSVLSWLIWLSLLSGDEMLRVLARATESQRVTTKADLSAQIRSMKNLGLIDAITLREPALNRHQRYYATDMGLYLYLSAVNPSPPISMARLAQSYPIERDDLLARLARPHLHLALTTLATHLIADGEPDYHLISYQQPWHHLFTVANKRHLLVADAAMLIQHAAGASYAFLAHVDTGPHQKAEREVEQLLLSLLDLRQRMVLYRQHWPDLLIISTRDRLPLWAHLLLASSFKRITKPLAGGITTLDALSESISAPIWRDLTTLALTENPDQTPLIPFSQLLRDPASAALVEQFSHQRHLYQVLLKEAAAPPPRTKQRLTRYVGDSLQQEAAHLTGERIEELFARKRQSRSSLEGTGLLTLALTTAEKDLLTWSAHHPLLDLATLQAVLRPMADPQAIKPLQQRMTRLFQLGLIETRLWPKGKTPLEQQRYLLTPSALKFMAIRQNEPFSAYFVTPKYQKGEDEQLDRQWGTRGLEGQMWHTNGLYAFMRQFYRRVHMRGEVLYQWKSAHEAARWYRDTISQDPGHARPDAELVFALSPQDERVTMVLLEYDRGTTREYQYFRKFKAYLDYQQASGMTLPLLIVAPSEKAAQRMRHVLDELQGTLRIVLLLEADLLAEGLALVLHHFPP
jgi:Replication-relaxation